MPALPQGSGGYTGFRLCEGDQRDFRSALETCGSHLIRQKATTPRRSISPLLRLPLNKQGSDAANLRWIPSASEEIQGLRRNPSRPGSQPRDLPARKQRGLGESPFDSPSGFPPLLPPKAAPRKLSTVAVIKTIPDKLWTPSAPLLFSYPAQHKTNRQNALLHPACSDFTGFPVPCGPCPAPWYRA